MRWSDAVESDLKDAGITFQEAIAVAQDRKNWCDLVLVLYGPGPWQQQQQQHKLNSLSLYILVDKVLSLSDAIKS